MLKMLVLTGSSMLAIAAIAVTPAGAQTARTTAQGDASTQATAQPGSQTAPASGRATPEGDIVVTARKREERLLDVPETITAYSGPTLTKAGIRTLDDLGRSVANVNFNRRADNEPNVVIRGIGSFGNVQGVGFYFDDVQNFTDQSSPLVDLERVEVLKGPQGTLYGGSSIGGAVKYITKKPTDTMEGTMRLEGGERRTFNASGSINLPITDNLFFRASAYTNNTNGFSRNPITDVNNDDSHEYGVRAALRWVPNSGSEVLLTVRHSYLDNGGQDYVLTNAVTDYRFSNPLNENVYNRRQIWAGTLLVNQDFGFATLTSLTSYTLRKVNVHWDLDYTPLDIITIPYGQPPQKTPVVTQELRLTSNGEGPFSWIVGLYGARTKDRIVGLRGGIILGTDATGGPPLLIPNYRDGSSVDHNYAAFATGTYRFGRLELTAGARLNYNKFFGSNGNIPAAISVKDTRVLPKVSLSYRASDAVLLYASVAEGYEPGKVNLYSTELFPYKPETAVNYEIGAKGQTATGLFSYEVAGFYITNKDRQFETQIKDYTGTPADLTANIGDARSWGAEASITVRPVAGLVLNASGGYLHSKYRDAVFNGIPYSHNVVPNSPRFSGYASADYSVPLGDHLRVNARADLSHTGSFFWDVPNKARQPAYDIIGARLALASVDDRWELAVRADNLFNKHYNSEFFYNFESDPTLDPNQINATCDMCHLARVGQPRQILASLSYRFR